LFQTINSSLVLVIQIQLLDNPRCVLNHLRVVRSRCLGKRVDDLSDLHLLKLAPTFLVNAQVSYRK